jgi:hypothetical protein
MASAKSTTARTLEMTEALLLEMIKSASILEMETRLVMAPPRFGRAMSVMLPPALRARVGITHDTTPLL